MKPRPRNFAQLLLFVAGAAASVAVAPIADADPTDVPEVGSESASATIQDLRAQGFNVSIKWVIGTPNLDRRVEVVAHAGAVPTMSASTDTTARRGLCMKQQPWITN